MIQFQIDDKNYRLEKLDTFSQLHLARKVAPLLPKLLPVLPVALVVGMQIKEATDNGQSIPTSSMESISYILEPAIEAMATMSKEDVEYVVSLCLTVAKRQNGDIWMAAWHNGQLMLGDMDMVTMMKIVWKVIEMNLANYFPISLLQPPAAAASQQAG